MPENLVDEKQRSDQKPAPTAPPANRRRTSRVLILLLLMLVICVAMIVGYRQGVVQTALRHAQSMYLLSKGDRVLTKTTQENLVSPGSASGVVGKSAVDVSPVLSVEPVQATSRPTESKPETPGPGEEESVPEKPLPGEQPAQPTVAVGPVATVSGTKAPKIVETPVIVPRQPPEESKPEPTEPSRVGAAPTETKEQTAEIEREKKEPKETKRRGPVAHPAEKTKRVGARSALGATASVQKPEAKVEASGVKEDSASRGDDKGKGERFQL
ncbi:MAG: hypothetical protein FJY85_15235, partial [Deltaproteobacteria bacterium]|nr:hypothetical protein [Deltaproteobacteria bacterium]